MGVTLLCFNRLKTVIKYAVVKKAMLRRAILSGILMDEPQCLGYLIDREIGKLANFLSLDGMG